jgi:hypothetical protein
MSPRLAVLIDADNVSARNWPRIRERIDGLGTVTSCRVFGDFSGSRLAAWMKIAREDALQAVMQFPGPNASDIAIAVSAMDLLYGSKLEGMCIVSSDADFTPLVHRLRSAGLKVYGFGNTKSAASLKKACTEFMTTTDLNKPVVVPKAA